MALRSVGLNAICMIVNTRYDIPENGDTVVGHTVSNKGNIVWLRFASGKVVSFHIVPSQSWEEEELEFTKERID